MQSPMIPIIAGWCDWFQPSAAWAHLDNKMACSVWTHTYRCKCSLSTHAHTNRHADRRTDSIFTDTETQPDRHKPASSEL